MTFHDLGRIPQDLDFGMALHGVLELLGNFFCNGFVKIVLSAILANISRNPLDNDQALSSLRFHCGKSRSEVAFPTNDAFHGFLLFRKS